MDTIGFIGAGNMAEAFIKGIITSGLYKEDSVIASDVRPERLQYLRETYKIRTTLDNLELVRYAKVVVLSVKPQNMAKMLDGIAGKLRENVLVISIAAGITTGYLHRKLGNVQIIRSMPNTPAMVGEGASALYCTDVSDKAQKRAVELFSAVGKAVIVDKEELIDAVTAVSGSGPAYFFLLMEEMVRAAEQMGIPTDIAEELVYQTAKGAGLLAKQAYGRGESPAELRRKVTSPRGTTEAAMEVFKNQHLGEALMAGMIRARQRSIELSQEVEKE
jgi:pyrroline-5-carboxylate reductase